MRLCNHQRHSKLSIYIKELKIYNAAARRRAFKRNKMFMEDNSYEYFDVHGPRSVLYCIVILNATSD